MKRIIGLAVLAVMLTVSAARADEGMWLLNLLNKKNIEQMRKCGLKLSKEEIYSLNKSCLKDNIIIFGRGCTGEIVSDQGLILTNHHCGYESIQQRSSVDHDYLKNGFWAMSKEEELPNPGLQVRFIREVRDVTPQMLEGVTPSMTEAQRAEVINRNGKAVADKETQAGNRYEISVRDIFGGNQYIMIIAEVFDDVRLVGAPPTSIGKFGGETDNWMWPRHTGDFSVFRVYAAPDNSPAAYSKENVPYRPKNHLKISLKGYKPGDYTMIMGFPGRTQRYMSSYEIDKTLEQDNPNRIYIRGERQKLLMEDMKASDKVRIQYASKYAQSSNYWKNSIGMSRGLKNLNVKAQKEAIEARFTAWVNADDARKAKYGDALTLKREGVEKGRPYENIIQIYTEALFSGSELIGMVAEGSQMLSQLAEILKNGKEIPADQKAQIRASLEEMFKDYNLPTDRKVAKRMFEIVKEKLAADELPDLYEKQINARFNGNIAAYIDDMYDRSFFTSAEKLQSLMDNFSVEKLQNDPAYAAMVSIRTKAVTYSKEFNKCRELTARGHRLFIAGLMEMDADKTFYPDANFTLRLTYGKVLPYEPKDGVLYKYFTTLKGVMEKEDPENPMEFSVDPRLKELYAKKDYGQYGWNGEMPVAFLSNNDITGGNSGSPIMNAKGELIGLAFDGNWEAMSGDIAFEPDLQRTINVDIRYVLFVIDKFAGAGHLVQEMTLVK